MAAPLALSRGDLRQDLQGPEPGQGERPGRPKGRHHAGRPGPHRSTRVPTRRVEVKPQRDQGGCRAGPGKPVPRISRGLGARRASVGSL